MSAETMTTLDPRRPRWILYTLLGVFGLLYAYAVWNAVAYMIPLVGMALDATTWVALVLAIAMPVIVFVLAVALTRRRGARRGRPGAPGRARRGGGVLAGRGRVHPLRRALTFSGGD